MPPAAPFALTESAKQEIRRVADALTGRTGKAMIPAIMWIDPDSNGGRMEAGVAIGFYEDEQRPEIERDIVLADGMEIVLAVSVEDRARFVGKTLDFDGAAIVIR